MLNTMAFASHHNEEAFEKKALEYITEAGTSLKIVEKKWRRVPKDTSDWIWGKIKDNIEAMDGLSDEQQTRYDEIKAIVGK
jgi:hypothetical protein